MLIASTRPGAGRAAASVNRAARSGVRTSSFASGKETDAELWLLPGKTLGFSHRDRPLDCQADPGNFAAVALT